MRELLLQLFTWWNGQTLGTRFHTWRKGEFVGEDEAGNKYYQTADASRRWVIYNGYAEASAIPPGWHGWMHHKVDVPPPKEDYQAHEWQAPHQQNLTGSAGAYRPPNSLLATARKPEAEKGYKAWQPD